MPRISELKKSKKGSVDLFIDGVFWKNVSAGTVAELGILKGRELTEEELTFLGEEVELKEALNIAFVFLGHRSRSSCEVRRRLAKAGFGGKVAASVVEKLTELGYLDDSAFANQWISSRAKSRHLGSKRLRNELQTLGVADELIAKNIEYFCDCEAEEQRALLLAKSRFERMGGLPENVLKRRLINALIYRGFTSNVAIRVTEQVIKEQVDVVEKLVT